ncbi:MAG: phosphate signaling complex protein PhoU [Verrucomicrobium sp.]|nr:phosphate signaling complex protein PhoU [Verrucomicrobium sp.]
MPDNRQHILATFDDALAALRRDVLMMASLTDRSLHNAMQGLFKGDAGLCGVAIADDDEIDQLERQIDAKGTDILIRFHPFASDLRQVVSAMKLGNNIERVADAAVNIAKRARKLSSIPTGEDRTLLSKLFSDAVELFDDSVKAYAEADVDLARSLKARDKLIDELNASLAERFTDRISKETDKVRDYLDLIFIARHLERVGDHAKNIAEDAIYAAAGEDVRHQGGKL